MLLSLTKKFLFIANLKTASTSIERVLSPHCELRLNQSRFGKHQSFSEFAERFKWLLGCTNINDIFIFGVMRDPVDYVLSIYNSHRRDVFRDNQRLYTGDLDFAQFISQWVPKNADQLRPQHLRFTSAEGRLVTNLLLSYDHLEDGLRIVADRIGVPDLKNMPKTNVSPSGVGRTDLTPDQVLWIEQKFSRDKEIIERHCNVLREVHASP
jgi:hypothetical protein